MATLTFPDDLKYAKSDEWVRLEGDTATVGISDYAQDALNDIVYVELPEVGSRVTAGQSFGTIESVKAASDIYSPVSGEVTAVNSDLEDTPETINSAPYEGGWLIQVRVSDPAELDHLMDAAAYRSYNETR